MIRAALDRLEGSLQRAGAFLARPAPHRAAVVAILLFAVALRLPLAAVADEVPNGHNDANIYFNQVHAVWLAGDFYPDYDRGSGWQWLLWLTFQAFDVPPGEWTGKGVPLEGATAHAALLAYTLSVMLSVGILAATYLVARQLLPPVATLAALLLVAVDPYLLFTSHSAMSEPPYTAILVLALAAALKARQHPAWLAGVGALMALAFVLRVNGLVMFVMLLAFAAILLPRTRRTWMWTGAAVAAFALVASPYLVWREVDGPGAMDFGTNQRFWADNLWDMSDRYWTERNAGVEEPHKETMAEYFATHTLAQAAGRLAISIQWGVFDFLGFGKWPAQQVEGGVWPGTPPDGSALTPFLVSLAAVAAFTAWRRKELLFVPLAIAFTFATFVWIYPLVRSVRYFAPLIPLVILYAMVGWDHLAKHVPRPALAGTLVFGAYAVIYATSVALTIPQGLALLLVPDVGWLIASLTLGWTALVFLPDLPAAASALRRLVPWGKRSPQ